jgi:hypothetical protein
MKGNVAFTMKDMVLRALSVYLLKQDVVSASRSAAAQRERREVDELDRAVGPIAEQIHG